MNIMEYCDDLQELYTRLDTNLHITDQVWWHRAARSSMTKLSRRRSIGMEDELDMGDIREVEAQ